PQFSEAESAARRDTTGTITSEGPCCHHSRGSHKNKQSVQTVSCCPLDATLLQKQNPVSFPGTSSLFAAGTLLLSRSPLPLTAGAETTASLLSHTGRDILLQARILRI